MEDDFFQRTRDLLETAYVASDTPQGQSGFSGDAERWRRARVGIADAMDRSGTFLDIGCANGLLMQSVQAWTAERGLVIEPYGLDFSSKLIELARARVPEWHDRFMFGNAIDWQPPFLFDFVRTELVYVPESRYQTLIDRLLDEVVKPGGRLILCSYGSSRRPEPRADPLADWLRDWGYQVSHESAQRELNGRVVCRIACIDRPGERC